MSMLIWRKKFAEYLMLNKLCLVKQTGTEEISEVAVTAFLSHKFINIQIHVDVWESKTTSWSYISMTPLIQNVGKVFNKLQARIICPIIKIQTWLQWVLEVL